jgi:hypothetical protein
MDNFEVFLISFDEVDGDSNWRHLLRTVPTAIRIHGIKGAAAAYHEAASKAKNKYFYVVEGDNQLMPDFEFKNIEDGAVHVWPNINRSGQFSSYQGCIKAFPTDKFKDYEFCKVDTMLNIEHVPIVFEEIPASWHGFDVNSKDTIRHTIKQVLRLRTLIEFGNFYSQLELNKWKEYPHSIQSADIKWAIEYAEKMDLNSIDDDFYDNYDALDKIVEEYMSVRVLAGND